MPTRKPNAQNGNSLDAFASSLELRQLTINNPVFEGGNGFPRSTPEYMHIRTKFDGDTETDLNAEADVELFISTEKYQALHYIDSTGDGFVSVNVAPSNLFSYPVARV